MLTRFIKMPIPVPLFTLLIVLLFIMTGCGFSTNGSPGGGSSGTSAQIDWVDFIRFQGITYITDDQSIAPSLLGPAFARVKFELAGNISDPNYHSKDGDAAFLDPGTIVYTVKRYRSTFRLAAHESRNGLLVLYEADTNPRAKHGSDLVDIAGKVRYIGVKSREDDTLQLGTIRNPGTVNSLVNMVLTAPVNQHFNGSSGTSYVVVFYLNDGTTLSRMFWPNSGELSRGIMLPRAFGIAIQRAIVR